MLCICDKYLLFLLCIGFAYIIIIYILQDSYNTLFFNYCDNLLTDRICNLYTWYPISIYIRHSVCKPSVDFSVVLFKMA